MPVARVRGPPWTYHVLASSAVKKISTFAGPCLAVTQSAIRAVGAFIVGLAVLAERNQKRRVDAYWHCRERA